MEAYSRFAEVYDFLMKDTDYDGWVNYIERIFKRNNYKPKKILELACGTGNITNRLIKKGYDVVGVDISSDMLTFAKQKANELGLRSNYLNQDMIDLEITKSFDCVLCLCDGFNYILDSQDLNLIFYKVYNILQEGGYFIFDISSYHKISNILGNNTYAENYDHVSYIWENYFDDKTNICELDLTIFLKKNGLYEKIEETHIQRAYRVEEINKLLNNYNFSKLDVVKAFSFNDWDDKDERIYFICRK